jgi:hypothetical protein
MTKKKKKHAASLVVLALFTIMALGSVEDEDAIKEVPIVEGTVVDMGRDAGKSDATWGVVGYDSKNGTATYGYVNGPNAESMHWWIKIRNDQGREKRFNVWAWEYYMIEIGDFWRDEWYK